MPSGASTASGLTAAKLVSALVLSICSGCSGTNLAVPGGAPTQAATAAEPTTTGSIGRSPKTFGADLDEEDWRRAYAAMSVALDPQGNGKPVKWENPDTTLRGMISPTGLPYVAEDQVCRDFLASVVAPGASRFVRGTGCKPAGGEWVLKRLRSAKEPGKDQGSKKRGAKA